MIRSGLCLLLALVAMAVGSETLLAQPPSGSSSVSLSLIQSPSVQSELGLDPSQVERANDLRNRLFAQRRESASRRQQLLPNNVTTGRPTREDTQSLAALRLSPAQQRRLGEIELQYMLKRGLASYLLSNTELADRLDMNKEQKQQLRDMIESDVRAARLERQKFQPNAKAEEKGASQARRILNNVLDPQQRDLLRDLQGEPMKDDRRR